MAEYLGKVSNIVTVKELENCFSFNVGTSIHSGDITFLKFLDNDKELLIADRGIRGSVSYDMINSLGLVEGKEIKTSKFKFKCRLISEQEWLDCIVTHTPNLDYSNWNGVYTITSTLDTVGNYSAPSVSYGYSKVDTKGYSTKNNVTNKYWRPVLEVVEFPPTILIFDTDLGTINIPPNLTYSISSRHEFNFTFTEKLDGAIIRFLGN